jgi:hypothetical protein
VKLPNQIGLEGDVTPPQYMSEVVLREVETERVLLVKLTDVVKL